jgi:hypothetical protein
MTCGSWQAAAAAAQRQRDKHVGRQRRPVLHSSCPKECMQTAVPCLVVWTGAQSSPALGTASSAWYCQQRLVLPAAQVCLGAHPRSCALFPGGGQGRCAAARGPCSDAREPWHIGVRSQDLCAGIASCRGTYTSTHLLGACCPYANRG